MAKKKASTKSGGLFELHGDRDEEDERIVRTAPGPSLARLGAEIRSSPRPLVRLSSRSCDPSTRRLSNTWSTTALTGFCHERAHLGACFPLRCFQRLSGTDIATERCPWQDNSYTIGPLTPVLSYWGQLLSTHLRAHWIETDYLLLGQLISVFAGTLRRRRDPTISSRPKSSPAYGL